MKVYAVVNAYNKNSINNNPKEDLNIQVMPLEDIHAQRIQDDRSHAFLDDWAKYAKPGDMLLLEKMLIFRRQDEPDGETGGPSADSED